MNNTFTAENFLLVPPPVPQNDGTVPPKAAATDVEPLFLVDDEVAMFYLIHVGAMSW
jgi:hypothetical protein